MGFRPSFFACDKDSAEIAAIGSVFPSVRPAIFPSYQIFLAHRTHLPGDANDIIPNHLICWPHMSTESICLFPLPLTPSSRRAFSRPLARSFFGAYSVAFVVIFVAL